MASRLSSRDVSGFKFIFFLAIIYAIISLLVHSVLHMKFITPLSIDAPLDRFSEARAIHHVAVLTEDDRQEGRPGLRKAAAYIKEQLEMLKERAESNIRIEVEETTVNGSFNMIFLGHSISFAYRDHINIVARIIEEWDVFFPLRTGAPIFLWNSLESMIGDSLGGEIHPLRKDVSSILKGLDFAPLSRNCGLWSLDLLHISYSAHEILIAF